MIALDPWVSLWGRGRGEKKSQMVFHARPAGALDYTRYHLRPPHDTPVPLFSGSPLDLAISATAVLRAIQGPQILF